SRRAWRPTRCSPRPSARSSRSALTPTRPDARATGAWRLRRCRVRGSATTPAMGDNRDDIAGLLLALRECPAAPRDTLRRHRIEALAARAARLDGSARQLLDDRLRALIEAELQSKAPTSTSSTPTQDATVADRPGARSLS